MTGVDQQQQAVEPSADSGGVMTFWEHLGELKRRVGFALIAVAIEGLFAPYDLEDRGHDFVAYFLLFFSSFFSFFSAFFLASLRLFFQMTVPPCPRPTHIVVSPYLAFGFSEKACIR